MDNAVLENTRGLRSVPVARRMSWASERQTTRMEDIAYSLLGRFGVNMPLIYAEGPKAFKGLQEEIVKESYDLSLFAWQQQPGPLQKHRGVLTISVVEFSNCREINHPIKGAAIPHKFALTSRGLRIGTALVDINGVTSDGKALVFNLGFSFHRD